ncbi:protein translocase subunit SecF [Marinimicrobium alkaliphilum]|uniref:protein translocase subunit SecF n=1 Tax=Marinimicrobium alkaliphilum TaxID=2202654 RepID=UPI001E615D7B|nr:protein translocase subunit SecF [Marinimicrobium alkaliphilum]
MAQEELKSINFMGWRKTIGAISILLLLVSIVSLAVNGLRLGLDFTGGTQIEVGFAEPANLGEIRTLLVEQGLENPTAVYFGSETEVLIRTQGAMQDGALVLIGNRLEALEPGAQIVRVERPAAGQAGLSQVIVLDGVSAAQVRDTDIFDRTYFGNVEFAQVEDGLAVTLENSLDVAYTNRLLTALSEHANTDVELRRSEFVGPQIGEELRDEGGLGMLVALFLVMLYIAFRFQYKFALGAVAALIHDVILVLGFFSLFQLDFDLTVLAAVLAVIGYSLNDTIVVFDRIRENFRLVRRGSPKEVVNFSLTQTLERTLITSLTTLLVLVMLFLFGGELINNFATALIVGVLVGTYSSIYVSANTLLALHIDREDLIPPPKEGEEQEELVP